MVVRRGRERGAVVIGAEVDAVEVVRGHSHDWFPGLSSAGAAVREAARKARQDGREADVFMWYG